MTAIPVIQSKGYEDTDLTFQSTWVGGDTVANNGRTLLVFKNTSGSGLTAMLDTPALVNGLTVQNPTVTVTSAADQVIGPFDPALFNTAAGLINITYSGSDATGLVAAVSV